ncbi:M23 family metallopeptidase [Bradyrhizobium lablabi]|uniref:M23 family metallopeptidase n=1 Tax=Bradyrhizobium lablabi TaxID=722472 RepID=UPI001BA7D183|nr:M23 family metallopeptidase [Bradyrhizobium lablabi]MBR0697747.1 M23 family metallopeptidase [Bradyrhizobium lablabi]
MACRIGPLFPVFIAAVVAGYRSPAVAQTIQLMLPIACEVGRTCHIQNYTDLDPSPAARDYMCGTLSYDDHNGTDFRLPSKAAQRAGVEVLAAAAGRVLRTRDGLADGTGGKPDREAVRDIECGNGAVIEHAGNWQTQYCHMAKGSLLVKPGDAVKPGQPIGRVGLSGLSEYPHLHFTVRHDDAVVDPFGFGAPPEKCGGGQSLWASEFRPQLAYHARVVLNAGFAGEPVTMELVEDGSAERQSPSASSDSIVVFVRAIGLKTGDVQRLELKDPHGTVIAENRAGPLQGNKAQYLLFTGRKRPPEGWLRGSYKASYVVERDGQVVLAKDLELTL